MRERTGFAGQQYVVTCTGLRPDGERSVVGWTNDPTGGGLVEMINLHPSMTDAEVHKIEKEAE
jgi:hypothetical protein